MKKVITLLLSVVLVFGAAAPAALAAADVKAADVEDVQPRYARIRTFVTDFSIDSSWKSTCYFYVKSSVSTDTVDLTMELQRLEGESWKTKKTWTTSDTYSATLDKDWYVTPGYEYRILVTALIYDANGTLLEMVVDYN